MRLVPIRRLVEVRCRAGLILVRGAGVRPTDLVRSQHRDGLEEGALIGALVDPVSYVSSVSWVARVNAAETHETFHYESGMRYHHNIWQS